MQRVIAVYGHSTCVHFAIPYGRFGARTGSGPHLKLIAKGIDDYRIVDLRSHAEASRVEIDPSGIEPADCSPRDKNQIPGRD